MAYFKFPISRDPPEGGTWERRLKEGKDFVFPISRDPPEGGTFKSKPGSE